MDENLIKGDTTELQCILDFQKRGFYVSIPFSGSCKYDVVADINGKLIRIQCKTAKYENGVILFSTSRQTTNTQKTTRYFYTSDEIDYFYTCWNNYGFLIPVAETSGVGKTLRLEKPKNGMQSQMNVANDYLIDFVVNSIINNTSIQLFTENNLISIDENGNERIWNVNDIVKMWGDRGLRYIRECASKHKICYSLHWKFKDFPTLK